MDLKARLHRLSEFRQEAGDAAPTVASLSPQSAAYEPPLEALVAGEWVASSGGRCFVSEHMYPLEHDHGGMRLGDWFSVPSEAWAPFLVTENGQGLDPQQGVFVDIETTGLARGAGTYAFLIGLGFFANSHFRVRQYFMPDFGEEPTMLDLVAQDLARHKGLISFNGRTFDWPIIENRYVLARCAPPAVSLPHLDVLSLARRLWRRTLSSCALSALEASLLQMKRDQADVPGYLIPQIYLDYVRWGRTRPMVGVFYHNLTDILSLVALAIRSGQVICPALRREQDQFCDHIALGAIQESLGHSDEATQSYQLALRRASDSQYPQREDAAIATKRLSLLLKRLGRYEEAMVLWRTQMDGPEIYPYLELAKHLEHRLRDYEAAREVIRAAITWIRTSGAPLAWQERRRLLVDLEHRLGRVEKRLSATGGRGGGEREA
jgi:uncharacterized protein